MRRSLPYNLTQGDLVPEPSSLERLEHDTLPSLFMMCVEVQNTMDVADRRRVWDAALALYPNLLDREDCNKYDRVELFRLAFDTAMVWEFG